MDLPLGPPSLDSVSCHLSSSLNTPVTPIEIEDTLVTPIEIENVEISAIGSMPTNIYAHELTHDNVNFFYFLFLINEKGKKKKKLQEMIFSTIKRKIQQQN
jgi:hypothetical protein